MPEFNTGDRVRLKDFRGGVPPFGTLVRFHYFMGMWAVEMDKPFPGGHSCSNLVVRTDRGWWVSEPNMERISEETSKLHKSVRAYINRELGR